MENIKSLLADEEDTIAESFVDDTEEISDSQNFGDKERLNADIDALLNEELEISQIYEESLRKNGESQNPGESMFSLGDSSGYESLAMKTEVLSDSEEKKEGEKESFSGIGSGISNGNGNGSGNGSIEVNVRIENEGRGQSLGLANGKPSVGIFLDVILRKLECLTSNNLYVNLHLTGLISRLAVYRQPLLQSFLLNPSVVFQPSIRSLFQVIEGDFGVRE